MVRYFILIFVAGIVGAIIARSKGRNQILWFILCAIVPLLVIAIAMLPSVVSMGLTKKCTNCAEIIKEDANVCKFCGTAINNIQL